MSTERWISTNCPSISRLQKKRACDLRPMPTTTAGDVPDLDLEAASLPTQVHDSWRHGRPHCRLLSAPCHATARGARNRGARDPSVPPCAGSAKWRKQALDLACSPTFCQAQARHCATTTDARMYSAPHPSPRLATSEDSVLPTSRACCVREHSDVTLWGIARSVRSTMCLSSVRGVNGNLFDHLTSCCVHTVCLGVKIAHLAFNTYVCLFVLCSPRRASRSPKLGHWRSTSREHCLD